MEHSKRFKYNAKRALTASIKHWEDNVDKLRKANSYADAWMDNYNHKIRLNTGAAVHYGGEHCKCCAFKEKYLFCPVVKYSCGGNCFEEWKAFSNAVGDDKPISVLTTLAEAIVARLKKALEE